METEKRIKLYIFLVTFITGVLFSLEITQIGVRTWVDSLFTLSIVSLNFYLINKKFKELTKKD